MGALGGVAILGQKTCSVPGCRGQEFGQFNGRPICQMHMSAGITDACAVDLRKIAPRVLRFKRLRDDAIPPSYSHGHTEDAGLDLYSCMDVGLASGSFAFIPCGIAIELWPGFEAQVRSRSGLAAKHGVFVLNSPGTIDPSYRGEIGVILFNAGPKEYLVKKGDRVAQLVIARYEMVELLMTEELNETERGAGGMGSTGR